MNILALIPARGGSKGVPRKNIKLLQGIPLIGYSIKCAQESKLINKIIVSTDCEEIKSVAEQFGIEVPFLRPKEFATDTSLDGDFIKHSLQWLQTHENYIPDIIILLRPTTPLRQSDVVDKAITTILENENTSGLRSSHEVSESPFKWFTVENNYYAPICNEYSLEDTNKPRQAFPKVYLPNGYVDIIKPSYLDDMIYGKKILSFITKTSYEIDTLEDFEFIEYLLEKRGIK